MSALDLRPDPKELEKFNFKVLKNIDPDITTLLFSAGHVAVYVFDMEEQKWDHKGVKGPLFVYKRRNKPYYRFAVLNRIQFETLVEQISPDMQLENTDGYLLYKNVEGVINGIWFFERKNKDNFYEFLKGIISKLSINNGTDNADSDLLESGAMTVVGGEQQLHLSSPIPDHLLTPTATTTITSSPPPTPSTPTSPSTFSTPPPPENSNNNNSSNNHNKIPTKKTSEPAQVAHYASQKTAGRLKSSPLLYMHHHHHSASSTENLPTVALEASSPVGGHLHAATNRPMLPFMTATENLVQHQQQQPMPKPHQNSVLSKQKFKASLLQLVNTDSFIDSAYSEYLKSVSSNNAD